ncbi:putative ribonuclease H-like domain-containing protein [Tanacetum coccineum]
MALTSSSQAWLWHRHLSHLNFDTINLLSKYDIVTGLPKLKFVKDHLCSSYELGKAKRKSFKTKNTPSSKRRLQILHMDLCGPIRVERFNEGIEHQTSTARTPEQNRVVKRRNHTLVEAARTMLSATKVPLFFWDKAIATACFTQNRSLIIPRHKKTPYHIINGQKPSVKYSTQSRAYRVYNKRTRVIVETIHVNFDELPQMASDQVVSKSSDVTSADAPNQRQQQHITPSTSTTVVAPPLNIQTTPETISQAPTQALTVTANENIIQAETNKNMHKLTKTNLSTSLVHQYKNEGRHLLDITRRQLETDGEMCMFALTVSRTEPNNIKEAMVYSAWIESIQEERHQIHHFERLDLWELVDRPLCKNVINLKWLWKNKRDEENTIIRNKSRLVAKGYAQKEGIDFEELKQHFFTVL